MEIGTERPGLASADRGERSVRRWIRACSGEVEGAEDLMALYQGASKAVRGLLVGAASKEPNALFLMLSQEQDPELAAAIRARLFQSAACLAEPEPPSFVTDDQVVAERRLFGPFVQRVEVTSVGNRVLCCDLQRLSPALDQVDRSPDGVSFDAAMCEIARRVWRHRTQFGSMPQGATDLLELL